MDPLTHCLIGSVSAKAIKASPRRFWIMTLLGSAPDLDVLFSGFGSWAYLFQHRGLTHSVLGIVVQAFFYSLVFMKFDRGDFRQRTYHYSLPLIFHVFCDYVTSYGVPLFSPFSLAAYSWNLTGSLNLFPLALTAVGLWWMQAGKISGWRATIPLWAIWMLYFMLASVSRSYASKLAATPSSLLGLTPSLTSPFSWQALELDKEHNQYVYYNVDILSGRVKFLGRIPQPNTDFPVQKSLNSPLVQDFIKNNRWPVVRLEPTPAGWRVEWGSIIYSVRGMVRGKVAVNVATDGQIVSADPVVSYWNPQLN